MYKVIEAFPERYDGDHPYAVGDIYPREGWEPTSDRVKELLDGTNRAGKKYLKEAAGKPTKKKAEPKE